MSTKPVDFRLLKPSCVKKKKEKRWKKKQSISKCWTWGNSSVQHYASCTVHPVLRILYCASCTAHRNRVIRRINVRAFREDGIVFSIYRRGKQVRSSFALEQARWPIFLLHNFGVQIIRFNFGEIKKKRFIRGTEKDIAYTKPVAQWCKLWP